MTARKAADAAGDILRHHFLNLGLAGVETKSSEHGYDGMVTLADIQAEKAIINCIGHEFPNHEFLAEETANSTATLVPFETEHLWIVDPLDGTNNFAHGIPHYAVSIAYYQYGVPKVGVILRPETSEWFLCTEGEGAFSEKNGRSVRATVNQHQSLSETMIGVGFYYDRGEMMQATLKTVERLFQQQIHGIRRMGTAALDIVQVGTGQFGAFFEYQLSPWDFAAARLFLKEAGGQITTCDGNELPLEKCSVLATNGQLHERMLQIV